LGAALVLLLLVVPSSFNPLAGMIRTLLSAIHQEAKQRTKSATYCLLVSFSCDDFFVGWENLLDNDELFSLMYKFQISMMARDIFEQQRC
jgi:hypothetical protein